MNVSGLPPKNWSSRKGSDAFDALEKELRRTKARQSSTMSSFSPEQNGTSSWRPTGSSASQGHWRRLFAGRQPPSEDRHPECEPEALSN